MKMNFEYFQIQKWMLQTVRAEKVDEKNGVMCLVFMFPFRVMVFKLSKKVHFCNLELTSVRNRSLLKQLHIYIWKVSLRTFRKRHCLLCYGLLSSRFGDIRVWSRRILLNFRWVSILFNTQIANISWRWLRPL